MDIDREDQGGLRDQRLLVSSMYEIINILVIVMICWSGGKAAIETRV